ncbi:hypothetical protein HDZ31DRAFT_71930 [Schizophyllum fasciatum]
MHTGKLLLLSRFAPMKAVPAPIDQQQISAERTHDTQDWSFLRDGATCDDISMDTFNALPWIGDNEPIAPLELFAEPFDYNNLSLAVNAPALAVPLPALPYAAPNGVTLQVGAPSQPTAQGVYSPAASFVGAPCAAADTWNDQWMWTVAGQHASPVLSSHSDDTLTNSAAGSPLSAADSSFAAASPATTVDDCDVAPAFPSPPFLFPSAIQHGRPPRPPSPPPRSTVRADFEAALALPTRGAGPFIPQRMYAPTTRADRQRYVEDIAPEPSIFFWNKRGDSCGIPLVQALKRAVHDLEDADGFIFSGVRPSVSIRLEWPGYKQWTKQIPAKDFRKVPAPLTREKLAKEIAKCVRAFIKERQYRALDDTAFSPTAPRQPLDGAAPSSPGGSTFSSPGGSASSALDGGAVSSAPEGAAFSSSHVAPHRAWRVGGGSGIALEDLVLVSAHHVSRGSWQPHLRLRAPRV